MPVELDGSEGGQTLRTALSLALITQRAFRLDGFRSGKPSPGLRPRHLAVIRSAEALGGVAEGAQLGSEHLGFRPREVRGGEHVLELGSAGSGPLVLQCLFLPLALAGGGTLRLRGLTHAPKGPCYHHLAWVWLPLLEAYGLTGTLSLQQAGFFPDGVGEFRAEIGARREAPLRVEVPARGTLQDVEVRSLVGGLPFEIAARQARAAVAVLREQGIYCHADNLPVPSGRVPGSLVFIRAQFENTFAAFTQVGMRGADPEDVGRGAAEALARFMESAGALDEHLADQILLPAALLAAGRLGPSSPGTTVFTASSVTPHLRATQAVIERMLPVQIRVGPDGQVEVASNR